MWTKKYSYVLHLSGSRKKNVAVAEVVKDEIKWEESAVDEDSDLVNVPENGVEVECTEGNDVLFKDEEMFNKVDNDDDDFEWKEEPSNEMNDDSDDSDGKVLCH